MWYFWFKMDGSEFGGRLFTGTGYGGRCEFEPQSVFELLVIGN